MLAKRGELEEELMQFFIEQMPVLTFRYDIMSYPYSAIRADIHDGNSKEFNYYQHLPMPEATHQEEQLLLTFLQKGSLFYGFDTAPKEDIDETQLLSYFLDGNYKRDRGLVPAEYDWLGMMEDESWFYMYKFSRQQLLLENFWQSDLVAKSQPRFIDIQNKVYLDGDGRGIKIIANSQAELEKYLRDF